jgi:hypothetical protein
VPDKLKAIAIEMSTYWLGRQRGNEKINVTDIIADRIRGAVEIKNIGPKIFDDAVAEIILMLAQNSSHFESSPHYSRFVELVVSTRNEQSLLMYDNDAHNGEELLSSRQDDTGDGVALLSLNAVG